MTHPRFDEIGFTVRRETFFPRETSFENKPYAIQGPGEVVAWSQLFFKTEVLMTLNPHSSEERGVEVTVDAALHPDGSTMTFICLSAGTDAELRQPPSSQTVEVVHKDDRATIRFDLEPSGMAILAEEIIKRQRPPAMPAAFDSI